MVFSKLSALIRCMRPKQWAKNALIFVGLIFAGKISDPFAVYNTFRAFFCFCLLASSIYILNDLLDLENDKLHPKKKFRPLASGALDIKTAIVAMLILAPLSLIWAFWISIPFGYCALIYVLMTMGYTFMFKHVVIIDLLVLALGFAIRAYAGIAALNVQGYDTVPITEWFIACVLFLALFIVICKRRNELDLLQGESKEHRAVLEHYSKPFLDQLVSIATASAVLSYALYAIDQGKGLIYTLIFVIYGIFRYLHRVYHGNEGGAPEQTLLKDPVMLANALFWLISILYIYYFV